MHQICYIPTKIKQKLMAPIQEKQLTCLQKEERNLLSIISQYSLAPYVSFGFFFYFCFSSLLKDYSKLYYAWIQKLRVSQKSQISQDRHVHLSFHSRRTIAASVQTQQAHTILTQPDRKSAIADSQLPLKLQTDVPV